MTKIVQNLLNPAFYRPGGNSCLLGIALYLTALINKTPENSLTSGISCNRLDNLLNKVNSRSGVKGGRKSIGVISMSVN